MQLALLLSDERHVYEKYFDITFDTSQLPKADLVVFPGGSDWASSFYGKKAHPNTSTYDMIDYRQMRIAREAVKLNKKLAGHCRGAQLLCILNGDQLVQHVTGHGMSHGMQTIDGRFINVNSMHHQMMMPTKDFKLLAWSARNISRCYETTDQVGRVVDVGAPIIFEELPREPEVVYFNRIKGLAAQYHPEWMGKDTEGYQYYQELIQEYLL